MKRLFAIGLIAGLFSINVLAQIAVPPAAGNGSKESPYQIASLNNLFWIRNNPTTWDKHFIQTADIDATSTKNWNAGDGWSPIGSNSKNFSGSYDGQGYTINSLYSRVGGMFGYVSNSAIKNLGITNISILATRSDYVGAFIGNAYGTTSLIMCYSSGKIVANHSKIGGLIGRIAGGSLKYCYSNIAIVCDSHEKESGFGGLVGMAIYTIIDLCFSVGEIRYTNVEPQYIGGLIGQVEGHSTETHSIIVRNSYSKVNIRSQSHTSSGLIGYVAPVHTLGNKGKPLIINCVTLGTCRNGIMQRIYGVVDNCFYLHGNINELHERPGTKKTSEQLRTVSTYTDKSTIGLSYAWDFVSNPYDDTSNNDYWNIHPDINDGYPFLTWQEEGLFNLSLVSDPPDIGVSFSGSGKHTVSKNIEISAPPPVGYAFQEWTGDAEIMQYVANPNSNSTILVMPPRDVVLTAKFVAESYTIVASVSPAEGGTVSGTGSFNYNEEVTLIATPEEGYHFVHWSEDDEVVSTDAILNFNATEDRSLIAVFAINTYIITATSLENGTIQPSGEITVNHSQDQSFTITPDDGFLIDFISIDGNDLTGVSPENWDPDAGKYTFKNVVNNHTIEVGFKIDNTGINISEEIRFKVYPNPANEVVWVEFFHNGVRSAIIKLFNIHGEVLRQTVVKDPGNHKTEFNTHGLAQGMYLISFQNGDGQIIKKVLLGANKQ